MVLCIWMNECKIFIYMFISIGCFIHHVSWFTKCPTWINLSAQIFPSQKLSSEIFNQNEQTVTCYFSNQLIIFKEPNFHRRWFHLLVFSWWMASITQRSSDGYCYLSRKRSKERIQITSKYDITCWSPRFLLEDLFILHLIQSRFQQDMFVGVCYDCRVRST